MSPATTARAPAVTPLSASRGDESDSALRARLADEGYLFVPGLLPRGPVLAARAAILEHLHALGEIAAPPACAIATGSSRRAQTVADAGAFWRALSEAPTLRALTHGARLRAFMHRLLATPVTPFDFVWLRAMPGGRSSPLHFDRPYMGRGSDRVLSAWLPLGDVALEDGPLAIVAGAHRRDDLIAPILGHDVDRFPERPGFLARDALEFAQARGERLLASPVQAGDAVVFGLLTLHGSLPNRSPCGRVRLSCDCRYQPLTDTRDERWFGAPPPGHGGQGYAALSGARPLTAAPLRR